MRNALFAIICMVAVSGCGIFDKLSNQNAVNNTNGNKPYASPDAKPTPGTTETKPSPAASTLVPLLKKSSGKYSYEIKLMENAELKGRLMKLLGKDYVGMKAHWNVETPTEIEDDIFRASACEAHNCGSNNYVMFVDLKNDNINVFHIEDSGTKHYFERGEIKLPGKFASDLTNND